MSNKTSTPTDGNVAPNKKEPIHTGGDALYNQNCHDFLLNVWTAINSFTEEDKEKLLPKKLRDKFNRSENKGEYDPNYAYGNLYTDFLTDLEEKIDKIPDGENKKALLNAIFLNKSGLLERTAEKVVTPILSEPNDFTFSSFESAVTDHLNKDENKKINTYAPQWMGSIIGRVWASIGDFRPMKTTSIPCVKKYQYKTPALPTEIRMGTQAEYIWERNTGDTMRLETRINPLFDAWIKATKEVDPNKITHVYFNLLGRDRTGYEGDREKELTTKLDALEKKHPNIAVITLPAEHGLMSQTEHQYHAKDSQCSTMFNTMLNIASGEQEEGIRDFYISKGVKNKLYTSDEKNKLKELIKRSFKTILGVNDPENTKDQFSRAQFQAVYFHFIKFELTNFILDTLKPASFNTSCKDGIDRGGVASLYYNLMKSIALNKPLDEKEFQRGLHAAPTMVKGRGINHHGNLIWNAVHHYIEKNKTCPIEEKLKLVEELKWLEKWRDNFAPDNNQVSDINQLTQYVKDREKKGDFYHPFFSTTHSKITKIAAAKKLKTMIVNPKIKPQFTPLELAAISDGQLGKLVCNMATHGIDLTDIYLQQLEQYKESRKEQKVTFYSFFGHVTGLSKATKLSAVQSLIKFLKKEEFRPLENIGWNALHDGKLGDIVKTMEKNGFDLSALMTPTAIAPKSKK